MAAEADVNIPGHSGYTPLMVAAWALHLRCVFLLLKAGALVNKTNNNGHNAVKCHVTSGDNFNRTSYERICLMFFAAGEMIDGTTFDVRKTLTDTVPKLLLREDLKLNLRHLCRETIRKHLLAIEPHQQLFGKIPQLGLPSSQTEYLLYSVSLDDDYDDHYDDAAYNMALYSADYDSDEVSNLKELY